jgi:hypothetical protein
LGFYWITVRIGRPDECFVYSRFACQPLIWETQFMSVLQAPPPQKKKARGFSRRYFLNGSLIGAGVLTLGTLGYRLFALPNGAPAVTGGVLTRAEWACVEALALGFFPPGTPFGIDAKEADVAGYVDRYIGSLAPVDQKIVRALFWVYDQGAVIQGRLRPARFMNSDEARTYILGWEKSRLEFRRDLAVSLRTVIGMAYFAHPRAKASLGISDFCYSSGPTFLRPGSFS